MNSTLAYRDWRDLAACRGADPDLFFPPPADEPAAAGQVEAAKQVCAACPVRETCLDWALRHGQRFGVWGGTSEEERSAPAVSLSCRSGRHLKNGPGRCTACEKERLRELEKTRVRDQAAVYARRVARARGAQGVAA